EGLVAAHQQGVIHRDLKPDNIMLVDDNGRDLVKVLDFGIAKVTDPPAEAGEHQTRYGVVMGTPRYMSPEQAAGGAVDHRTDLYALGVILFEMLTGQAPFAASGLNAVLSQQLVNDPPPLPPHVPRDLAKVCSSLLAREADGRPESAVAVLDVLRAIRIEQAESPASRPLANITRLVRDKLQPLGAAFGANWSPLWRKAKAHAPVLAVFDRRVTLGNRSLTLGGLVLGLFATAFAATLFVASRTAPTGESSEPATVTAKPQEPAEKATSPSTAGISREDLDDLL